MHTLEETTAQDRELLENADVEDRDVTITRMGEALHEEGLTVETASPAQLTALLAESPDWVSGLIDGNPL